MAQYLIKGETIVNIADAIREKSGTTNAMFPENMPSYIRNITTASNNGDAPNDIVSEAERVANAMIPKIANNSITFIAMSDMHEMGDGDYTGSDTGLLERYRRANKNAGQGAKIISNLVPIDFFVNLGDFAWGSSSTTTYDLISSMVRARNYTFAVSDGVESFFAAGNHDVDSVSGFLDPEVVTGITGGYRYVDFADKKVRVICLNTADTIDGSTGTERISGEQLQWFAESLNLSDKSDATEWGIIVLSHHPVDWSATIMPLANCIAAYMNGEVYSVTHDGITISCDFAGKNSAKFIANFHGHVHCFKVANISGTTAKRVAIPNACFGRNNEYGSNGNTEFGETETYNKSDNSTGKNTAFCSIVVDLDAELIYAYCFGAGYDRIISYAKEEVITHSVTNNLANAINNNKEASVVEGSAYAALITANDGYEIKSIKVTMDGVDITSSAVNGNIISIGNVTGDIVINVTTDVVDNFDYGVFTNLVPLSQERDSTAIYNGVGYKNGVYTSETNDGADANTVCTGWIPYAWNTDNVLYIKGATLDTSNSHVRIFGFNAKNSVNNNIGYTSGTRINERFTVETLGDKYYKLTPVDTDNNVKYIRISLVGTGERLIVTINEPIHAVNPTQSYTVTNNFENVVNNNDATSVKEGFPYNATIYADSGYELDSVVVTMGGVDITSTAYRDGVISIGSVTGNIVISVTVKEIVTGGGYTNLIPTAQEMGSTAIYNGVGYKNDYRLSSSSPFESSGAGFVATGYIPYVVEANKLPGTIYIKGASWSEVSNCRMFFFEPKTTICGPQIKGGGTGNSALSVYYTIETLGDNYFRLVPVDTGGGTWSAQGIASSVTNAKYFRISLSGNGANLIITVNEPIG